MGCPPCEMVSDLSSMIGLDEGRASTKVGRAARMATSSAMLDLRDDAIESERRTRRSPQPSTNRSKVAEITGAVAMFVCQRYWRSAVDARGSAATGAPVRLRRRVSQRTVDRHGDGEPSGLSRATGYTNGRPLERGSHPALIALTM